MIICASCALTVLAAGDDKLFYYEGEAGHAPLRQTDYSPQGLRALLLRKKHEAALTNHRAVLIIKPGETSTFKNLINIIDESNIAVYGKYYLDKIDAREEILIAEQNL